MRATVLFASLLSVAACATVPPRVSATFSTPSVTARVAAPNLAIAPLIDARPAALRRTHTAGMSSYWGLALVYFAFGSGRSDGISQAGDANTKVTVNGREGSVTSQLDTYVREVITSATGSAPAAAASAELSDVRRAAAGRPDGVTIVPILDQFDMFRLSSYDSISGGSSYQSGNYQVTTSGYAMGSSSTGSFANMRLRLVLLETRGGQIVRQATAYIATSDAGGGLTAVLGAGVAPITQQLAAFMSTR